MYQKSENLKGVLREGLEHKSRNNLPIIDSPYKRLPGHTLDPQTTQKRVETKLGNEEGGCKQGRENLWKMRIEEEILTGNTPKHA